MPPNPRAALRASDNLRGIIAMVGASACFVAGDTIVKYAGQELPLGELIFLRGLFASCVTIVAAALSGALFHIPKFLTPAMILRTLAEVGATMLFFTALVRMPFADVTAIAQFTPLAITAGAALFFGEQVGWRRWLATAVGFAGILIIMRPGSTAFNWAALFVLGSVACVTVRDLITRRMGLALPATVIVAFSSLSVAVSGLFLLPFEEWRAPSLYLTFLMACAGMCIFGGYYWIVIAMRTGEIAVVAPFRYTATLLAVASGYAVFSEIPDGMTILGILIVMGAGLYTLHRERIRMRQHRLVERAAPTRL